MHKPDGDIVEKAKEIAHRAHDTQFRRDGVTPYIRHPEAVAVRVQGDPIAEATAWLHDVLEDTDWTEDALIAHKIPREVIDAVLVLTKQPRVSYSDYIDTIAKHPIARRVKIADMLANLGDSPTDRQILKYAKALKVLTETSEISLD